LTLKYTATVIDSLVKLLLSGTDEKTWDYNTDPVQEFPKRYQIRLCEWTSRKGITVHDENNFDFPSVQTTQSLASI